MVNTIFILDSRKQTSQILSTKVGSINTFWDDLYTQEFDTGAESFEFTCNSSENIKEGNYVAFFYNKQYKLFSIIEIEERHENGKLVSTCYCETSVLELLNHHIRPFSGDKNCIDFFQYILNETGWAIGKWNSSLADNIQTVNVDKITSVWSLIEEYKEVYECEINVRVSYENGRIIGQYIDLFSEGNLGEKTYKRFEYGRNVTGITKSKDLYDWCTGIIIDCDCDVSDKIFSIENGDEFNKAAGDVILNRSANEKYNNGRPYIMGVYSGKETDPTLACINAWKELTKRSEPKFDYEVDTALTSKEYEEINLGDTVHVIDNSYTPALFLEARVGTLELSFTDKTKNKCTLTNYKVLKSAIGSAELIKLTGTITDVVNTFFPIGSDGIADGAIIDGKIETTYYKQITADIVSASTGAFEELYAQGLTVINADIANLKAGKADITDLNATNGNITNLTSQVGNIETLLAGNATAGNVQSIHLTSANATIDNAVIKSAMIDSVNAGKVNTGTLNTNNVVIQSEDGGIKISGATQQFKDKEGHIRVQIGKDASGNFTFCLFSQDGVGILLDETGIKAGAVPDGLIVNDMVSDGANISGSKLDISSVITQINNNETTINSSHIKFDDTGQSLLVAFNQLKNQVDTIQEVTIGGDLSSVIEKVNTHTTEIGVMQGQISSLIENTTITKQDGTVVQLKDEYNNTVSTVNSNTTKIGTLESNYNKVTGDLESVTNRTTTLETNLSGVTARVSQTETDLNTTKSTIAEHSTTLEGVTSQISSLETNYNKVSGDIASVTSKQSALEQSLNGFKTTVSETYTTKDEFNNLSVGGRNLFRFSSAYLIGENNISSIWSTTNGGISKEKSSLYNGKEVYKLTCTASVNSYTELVAKYKSMYVESGKEYTLSGYYTPLSNCKGIKIILYKVENDSTLTAIYEASNTSASSNEAIYFDNTWTSTYTGNILMTIFNKGKINDTDGDSVLLFDNIKFEKGSKPTDWTAAPEDIDLELTTIKKDISTVTQTASSLTTEVSKKLDSDELSSRIQQSATDIRIGFNGINNYISISDSMGIRVNHTDGSYSRINEDGFLYYNSSTTNRYHSLHASGTLQLTGSGENEKFTITLPSSFSNVSDSDIILILSMDGPRFYASDGTYYTEYYSVSNWSSANWRKNSNGNWTTSSASGHYKLYNTLTKKSEYAKAYITYVALA